MILLQEDLKLWQPSPDKPPDLQPDMCKFILKQIGDQCCYLLRQEKEAINISLSEGSYLSPLSIP